MRIDPRVELKAREPTKRANHNYFVRTPALPVSPERSPSPDSLVGTPPSMKSPKSDLYSSIEVVEPSQFDPATESQPQDEAQSEGSCPAVERSVAQEISIPESIVQDSLNQEDPTHKNQSENSEGDVTTNEVRNETPGEIATVGASRITRTGDGLTESILDAMANVPSSPATAGPNDSNDEWAISSLGADPVLSLDDEDDDHDDHDALSEEHSSSGGPHLVMPRMMLAQSRSNSPRRQVGKLKLLVAGRRGTGKSRLIDSLITECPLISQATEAHVIGHSSMLFERRASTFAATDHNLAFVDSHGWATEDELADYVGSITDYLDALYQETASLVNGLNPASLQILAQSTSLAQFPHVDVCLYLLHGAQLAADDVVVLRAIEPYAAIIPVIAHADSLGLTASQLFDRKIELAKALKSAGIGCLQLHGYSHADGDGLPYAISTTMQYNLDMTASAVMAEGYRTHVFVESDLDRLTTQLLSNVGARTARTHTARKLVEWVASLHVRSTLVHSRPLLAPRQFVLDLSDAFAQVDEDVTISGDYVLPGAPRMSRCLTRRHETFALSVENGLRRHRRASFKSIENIDPLDLSGWSRAIKILAAVAAATAVATLGALGIGWISPPPPPPPCRAERARDFMNHWGLLLRMTLAA